jgi:hypothetical protein
MTAFAGSSSGAIAMNRNGMSVGTSWWLLDSEGELIELIESRTPDIAT